jgi:hypothetical protein
MLTTIAYAVLVTLLLWFIVTCLLSFVRIAPTQVGLVTRRFSSKELAEDNPIAFQGEAGYQADLLMSGIHWRFILLYAVEKYPWVQIPAGQIGVVIAQVGEPLPTGAKSAVYRSEFGQFADLVTFVSKGGQKGVQRLVLSPGTTLPIHPVGFLVITRDQVFGIPVSPEYTKGPLRAESFGLRPADLEVVRIERDHNDQRDMVGIITALEGDPLSSGDIASRLNGYQDIEEMERDNAPDAEVIERLLGNKNQLHNNYQDFQAFLNNGGRIGLQHDPLLYGAYNLNPFLVKVEKVPMLVVEQGQVAVIKAYVGPQRTHPVPNSSLVA